MYDLKKNFSFYASYHHNRVNVAIHFLCIWPILATAIAMLQYTPVVAATPDFMQNTGLKVNFAFIVALIYMVIYPLLEPVVGGGASLLVGLILLKSGSLVASGSLILGYPVWKIALAVHITAWILQFIGHGLFEGRAPALLDSLDQALLTAPLFVFMEIFFFFGYRPKLHAEVMAQVEANISEFKKSGKKA